MPRRRADRPSQAVRVQTYDEFQELIRAFAEGHLSLLVVLGRPGLSKSKSVAAAIEEKECLLLKGKVSDIRLYCDLYHHRDQPVICDDADRLLGDRSCRSYLKALTETDEYKRLDYNTATRVLEAGNVPRFFWTKSPVCIITNAWNSEDPIFQALESRAEFIEFAPTWAEVYRQVGTWFWDQEIFDYVWERLPMLREPDCRLFTRAWRRKQANLEHMDWQRLIDDHLDDMDSIIVSELMNDESFANNTARAKRFVESCGKDRATFYRRRAKILSYGPRENVERILLSRTSPCKTPRPEDGPLPSEDDV